MRTPKNRLQELAQNLHRRQAQQSAEQGLTLKQDKPSVEARSFDHNQPINLHPSGQGQPYQTDQGATVQAMAFDHNEAIELRYNQESGGYVSNTSTYAAAHSVDRNLDFDSEAFEVEAFEAEPVTSPSVSVQPEVVADQTQPMPIKSAVPSAPSIETTAPVQSNPSSPPEVATTEDFLEDLQAILKGEKTYDGNGLRSVSNQPQQVTEPSPQATQFSIPEPAAPTPEPAPPSPVELAQQTSPHDVFDRMAQGIPPEPTPPEPTPTYSNAHSIFDRMGKNMAFANSFDLGTISLQQRFGEFDRILDAEEDKTSNKDPILPSNLISNKFKSGTPSVEIDTNAKALQENHDVKSLENDAQAFSFEDELKSKAAEVNVKSIVERYSLKNSLEKNEVKDNDIGRGWEGLKADYAGTTTMEMIAQYRKDLVDRRLRDAIEATGQKGLVDFDDSGTQSPTSDYDVQLYDTGTLRGNPGLVIEKFYADFRAEFGMESGTLFDTNIYDPSYRMPRPMVPELEIIAKVEAEVSQTASYRHIEDAGAFAKIRKFMTESDWTEYRRELLSRLTGVLHNYAYHRPTEEALNKAEKLYGRYIKELNQRFTELGIQPLSATDDQKLWAKNLCYVKYLKDVQDQRKAQLSALESNPSISEELLNATQKLKEAMVIATLWAHEAYHSEGPMADVVGISQKTFKKALSEESKRMPPKAQEILVGDTRKDPRYEKSKLTQQDLTVLLRLWSVNENFGDALKDIDHYKANFQELAIQTSKYVDRLLTITETFFSRSNTLNDNQDLKDVYERQYSSLKILNKKFFDRRKKVHQQAVKELEGINAWVDLYNFLKNDKDAKTSDLVEAYKKTLVGLNLDVNAHVRRKLYN